MRGHWIVRLAIVGILCWTAVVVINGWNKRELSQQDLPTLSSFFPSVSITSDAEERLARAQQRIAELEQQLRDVGARPKDPRETWFENELAQWVAMHKLVVNDALPPRFLLCLDNYGLGNKIQVAVSCVLYALLTKRALVLANEIPGLERPEMKLHHEFKGNMWKDMHHLASLNLMCWNQTEFYEHDNDTWLALAGPWNFDYFASLLWYNPHLKLLNKLPANFFQLCFSAIFELQPAQRAIVDAFKRDHFGKYTIAVHIREQIKKYDPNFGRLPVPGVPITIQTAQTLAALQGVVPPEEVVWFVACEVGDTLKALQQQYGNKTVVYLPFKEDQRAADDALLIFWLMGDCDEIVTTDTSTYATNAAARANKIPILCNANNFCIRKLTAQPTQLAPHTKQMCEPPTFSSVDNEPGFFYNHYDGQRQKAEWDRQARKVKDDDADVFRRDQNNLTMCQEFLWKCLRS